MLRDEIESAKRAVRTDAYQMSVGEIVNMYKAQEIIIDPDFQRLFRWSTGQKSRLIESILLGIPLPSIFVFEKEDGRWELIDGLQRISTILEFMGVLKTSGDKIAKPSILDATTYLPSLHNVVWEKSSRIDDVPKTEQVALDVPDQLTIRRYRISVEILKRPSDNKTKFDLFQRLNAGGTQANSQELRNCVMLMVSPINFNLVKKAAEMKDFLDVVSLTDEQVDKQRHMELAVRFLVHVNVPYDGRLDVEEFVDRGIVDLLASKDLKTMIQTMNSTFEILNGIFGENALRRFDGEKFAGKVGLVGLETIAVGIASNLPRLLGRSNPKAYLKKRIQAMWLSKGVDSFTSPGLRGTTRIQRTVPFGKKWFSA